MLHEDHGSWSFAILIFYGISGKNCRRLFIGCGNARENVITGRKGEEKDESI